VIEDVPEQIEVLNHRGKNLSRNFAKGNYLTNVALFVCVKDHLYWERMTRL
jgi:hypothetical protein